MNTIATAQAGHPSIELLKETDLMSAYDLRSLQVQPLACSGNTDDNYADDPEWIDPTDVIKQAGAFTLPQLRL